MTMQLFALFFAGVVALLWVVQFGHDYLRKRRQATMNVDRPDLKLATLRAEVQQIRSENRVYFSRNGHSERERAEHQARRTRIENIREQLAALVNRARSA